MTATTADLTAAEAGARIAVIAPTHAAARDDLDRLAPFTGPDATTRRAKDRAAISFPSGGAIHFHSAAGNGLRGRTYDRIHLAEDAATDDTITHARLALTTTGELYIGTHLVAEPRTLDPDRDDAAQ
ncbi:hypothetical protein [Microbacterium testaceum]|uniref:hypothetical protein n=1 Tax=Microbacterium testaceum TaxID=2033 RepID=UPI002434DB90|nr:hypothetical protein [Microbacterium testaceum]